MFKIKQDKKQYDFLRRNSYWYKYLNRDPNNYGKFIKAYKKNNRNIRQNICSSICTNIPESFKLECL